MSKPTKFIVRFPDYNGYKNVLFMMQSNDCSFSKIEIIAPAKHDRKNRTAVAAGITYKVFADWSVRAE